MAYIKYYISDPLTGQKVEKQVKLPTDREITIGRGKGADIRIKNPTISRKHCRLYFSDGQFYLEDLGSSNGTFYAKRRLSQGTPIALDTGDTFFIGDLEITFILEEEDLIGFVPEPPSEDIATPAGSMEQVVQEEVKTPEEDYGISPTPEDEENIEVPSFEEEHKKDEMPEEIVENPSEGPGEGVVEIGEVRKTIVHEIEKESLQRQIELLQQQVQEKEATIQTLKRELEVSQNILETLKKEAAAGKVESDTDVDVDELQALLDATTVENDELREENERLKTRNEELETQLDDLSEKLEKKEKEIKNLESARQELMTELRETEGQVSELQEDLSQKNKAIEQLKQQLEELAKEKETLQKQIELLENENDELEQKISDIHTNMSNMTDSAEVEKLKEELERVNKERDALLEENKRWEELKQKSEQDISTLKGENEALKERIAQLQKELEDVRSSSQSDAQLQEQIERLTKELADTRRANKGYVKRMARLLEEQKRLKKELEAASAGSVSMDIDRFREAYEDLNEAVHKVANQIELLLEYLNRPDADSAKIAKIGSELNDLFDGLKSTLRAVEKLFYPEN